MSSTYSTNLALELIGTGDQAGNWGSTTNTNLGTLLEQAVSGYVSQAISGSDVTLAMTNGASATARNMFIQLTGAGNGSLIVPANKKLYFIYNTASTAVTVKVTGLTGVSVPVNAKVILVCDGTDIIDATNYSSNLTIGNRLVSGSINTYPTTSFTGAISGTTLTVSAVASGTLYIGQYISGSGVTSNTQITAGSGSSWTVSLSQTVSSTAMVGAAGATSTTTNSADNSTNIATAAFVKTSVAASFPAGGIIMWSGSIASIPTGWLLCNGTSGTPDLRDRFVVGAGTTYAVAATGGTADAVVVTHNHTATSVVTDPTHAHVSFSVFYTGGGSQNIAGDAYQGTSSGTATSAASTGITVATTNASAGVSGTNQNLPPYYALAYIMKA